ncbi:MAG: cytochrome c [Trueperaceae bacterium]|nr:cytochrome c [Trueperaceae bacterium]
MTKASPASRLKAALALVLVVLLWTGCGRNMFDQPRADAFQSSQFFEDGSAMRTLVPGTVSREFGGLDPAYLTGMNASGMVSEMPYPLDLDVLYRGQERYNIYCSPCHNYNGDGLGATVLRGFPQPVSFTSTDRLLDAPVGYYYTAMTNGFGRMLSYASRIPVEDRWAIAAYVKALQLSQNAAPSDVPATELHQLMNTEAGR